MAFESLPSNRLPGPLATAVNHFWRVDRLEQLYTRARVFGSRASSPELAGSAEQSVLFNRRLLEDLNISVNFSEEDLARVPTRGPVVAISKHLWNTLDGFVVVDLTRTAPEVLTRYMGKHEAREFLDRHRTPQPLVA